MAFSDRALIVCSSVSVLVFILTVYYWRSNNNKRSNKSRKGRQDSSINVHSNLESCQQEQHQKPQELNKITNQEEQESQHTKQQEQDPVLDSLLSNQIHKEESQNPVPDSVPSHQINKQESQDPVPDPEPSNQESSELKQESEDPKVEELKIPNQEQESQQTKPDPIHKKESGDRSSSSQDSFPITNQSNLESCQESGNRAPSNEDDAQAQQVAIDKDSITEANIDVCSFFDKEKMQLKNVSTLNVESSSLSGASCDSNGNSLTFKHFHNNKQDLNGDKLESNNNQQKIIEIEPLSSLNFSKKNRHKRSVDDEPATKPPAGITLNKNIEEVIKTDELSSPEITSKENSETQAEPAPGLFSKFNEESIINKEEESSSITSNKNIEPIINKTGQESPSGITSKNIESLAAINSKHIKEASQSTTNMDNNKVASSTRNIKKSYSEIIQEKQSPFNKSTQSTAALSSAKANQHKHTANIIANDNNKTSSPLQPCLNNVGGKESNNNSASFNHINQTTSSTTSTTMSAAASSFNKSINKPSMVSVNKIDSNEKALINNNNNIPDGFGGLAPLSTTPVQTTTHKQTFAQILLNNCDSNNINSNDNNSTSKSAAKHTSPSTSNINNENDTIDIYHNYPDVTITPTSDDNRNAGHLLDNYNEEFTSQGSNDSGQGSCLNEVMNSLSIIDLDNDNTGHHGDGDSPSSDAFDTIDRLKHNIDTMEHNDAPVAGTPGHARDLPSSEYATIDTIGRSNAAPVGRNVNRNELMDASKMSSISSSTIEYFNTSPLFSVIPDNHIIQYNFEIPIDMCGLLIGKKGRFINPLKANTGTNVFISDYTDKSNICHIYGPKQNVMNALNMIKYRLSMNPELTYDHIDFTPTIPLSQSCQLLLPSDVMSEVYLINTITPGHFFLQQPTHPTYPMLSQLDQMMTDNYSNTHAPLIPTVHAGIICAVQSHDGNWYRATVKYVHDNHKECDLLFVDYGLLSYNVPVNALRQIHCNFMTLPFQAIECYLDKIAPLDVETGWTPESINYFEELVRGQIIFAYVERYTENNVACVDLFKHQSDTNTRMNIAEELVKSGHAQWISS